MSKTKEGPIIHTCLFKNVYVTSRFSDQVAVSSNDVPPLYSRTVWVEFVYLPSWLIPIIGIFVSAFSLLASAASVQSRSSLPHVLICPSDLLSLQPSFELLHESEINCVLSRVELTACTEICGQAGLAPPRSPWSCLLQELGPLWMVRLQGLVSVSFVFWGGLSFCPPPRSSFQAVSQLPPQFTPDAGWPLSPQDPTVKENTQQQPGHKSC